MSVPLFDPLTLRGLTLRNRIGVSPMCQYSAIDGFANDWHLTHLGARAIGGAGMIVMEATGVTPEGRITPGCHGIWKDEHIEFLTRITGFIREQGAAPAIQLAHAGRKASSDLPWRGGKPLKTGEGAWETLAPSAIPFSKDAPAPKAMTAEDIKRVIESFAAAAQRAVKAGFQAIELHGAHGYLLHEFISPLSNRRDDNYGGSEENRFRLITEVLDAVRAVVPADMPVGARLSCSDWTAGGLTIDDSLRLSKQLKEHGADFIDCSSGGNVPDAKIPQGPGYQVPFSKELRAKAGIATAAVGLITEAKQANDIIAKGEADMVFLARAFLRDPFWALHAAQALGVEAKAPLQYLRAFDPPKKAA